MSAANTGFLKALLERFAKLPEAEAVECCVWAEVWLEHRNKEPKIDLLFAGCESPMERMFLLGAKLSGSGLFMHEVGGGWCDIRSTDGVEYRVVPQHEVYEEDDETEDFSPFARVDFRFFEPGKAYSLAIEIDGHEFHEKTKEQVAKDKARERRLVRSGHYVVRFAGSEVFADPVACWKEVISIAESLSEREEYRDEYLRESILEELTAPEKKPKLLEAPAETVEAAE